MEAFIFAVVFAVGFMLGAEHDSADSQADHAVESVDHAVGDLRPHAQSQA